MDFSTLLGIIVGFGSLIFAFVLEGGSVSSLIGLSAAIIVLGGTIGATMTSFSMKDILKLPKLIGKAFKEEGNKYLDIIKYFVYLSQKARSEGLLSLEQELQSDEIKNYDPILKDCIELVIDGADIELIKTTMENRIYIEDKALKKEASMFEAAGGYSPTMGIIGTVMGLVHVLGNLSQPDKLGPSIAVAFIATLYGVSMANLVWLPIGEKLKNKAQIKKTEKEIILEGSLSLQAGENPKIVEKKLMTFVVEKDAVSKESGLKGEVANEKI
ncbi:flagellar motor protein [Thermoanaerobacterium thermosaccharolyticum]|jgi:chemotaxis protein MotA|uniref:flagellar motor protein n=1 Tax=Thermoanaerobacterium thermosaccharolyticum TaxID=1517 RepID=UPI003D2E521B